MPSLEKRPPAAPDGSHIIIRSGIMFLGPLLTSAKRVHEPPPSLSRCQDRDLASRTTWLTRPPQGSDLCVCRNAASEPSYKLPEREGGHHLFLFYLLSSSMWKMIFTVSYLQSWIPCYFIPEQRHNREGLLFHAGGLFGLVQGRCECRGRVGSLCGAGGRWSWLGRGAQTDACDFK